MIADRLLPAQVEEILLEDLGTVAQLFGNRLRQRSLALDRALQGDDDRDFEITEQTHKALQISLEPGAAALVDLLQEEFLHVDDRAAAAIMLDAPDHRDVPM